MNIKSIIFDIGNVLAEFRWEGYLKDCGYSEEIIEKVSNATVKNALWKELDRSCIEYKSLIEQMCRKEPKVEKEIRRLFKDFRHLVEEYDYSVALLKSLKENGYRIYLLSNYSEKHFALANEYFHFLRYTDGGIISYEVKHIKPEAEIYEALIKKYDIEPKEAVFLDDLEENLEGAKPFGFHTIQVKSYVQMLEELHKLGVRCEV